MSHQDFQDMVSLLKEGGSIVKDGTWGERFFDGLMDPDQAADTGFAAMTDCEVIDQGSVVATLRYLDFIPTVAAASALRHVQTKSGLYSPDVEIVIGLFKGALSAPKILLTADEISILDQLPDVVEMFRGQLHGDSTDTPSGLSWTLSEDVADWYARPLPAQLRRGNVLQVMAPTAAILAISEDQLEVVIDLNMITEIIIISRVGCTNEVIETMGLGRV